MRVRMLTDMASAGGTVRRGDQIDFDDAEAARLVAAGSASPYEFDARLLSSASTPPRQAAKRDKR